MTSVTHLRERVRLELGDQPKPFDAAFFTDGIELQYRIDFHPLDPESVVLTVNGVPNTEWELDSRHGVVMFRELHPAGTVINLAGITFRYFNDNDIDVFCKEAIAEHSSGSLDLYGVQMTLDRMPTVQHHVVALRATVLALWALVSDAAFDIDIYAPDGVNIPRSERFRQLMELIGAKQGEYDSLSKALNIGLFRIEVFTFRRVAKLTNRLVPLYMTQEYDDPRPPTRLYTEISTQQWQFHAEDVHTMDLVLRKGASYSKVVQIDKDLTDCLSDPDNKVVAEILLFPGQSVPRATFKVEVLDASIGRFKLTLEPDDSKNVPTTAYWHMTVHTESGGGVLLAQGKVQAERPVGDLGTSPDYVAGYVGKTPIYNHPTQTQTITTSGKP